MMDGPLKVMQPFFRQQSGLHEFALNVGESLSKFRSRFAGAIGMDVVREIGVSYRCQKSRKISVGFIKVMLQRPELIYGGKTDSDSSCI
jgi:hypothetical protein